MFFQKPRPQVQSTEILVKKILKTVECDIYQESVPSPHHHLNASKWSSMEFYTLHGRWLPLVVSSTKCTLEIHINRYDISGHFYLIFSASG